MDVTIADVAKHAGVSRCTVTNVIHNKPEVTSQTKERVLRSIQELGFTPNEAAQNLRSRKRTLTGKQLTGNIGCIIYDTFNKYKDSVYADIMIGIDQELINKNYHLFFYHKLGQFVHDPLLLNKLIDVNKIDGLITLATQLEGIYDRVHERIKNVISIGESLGNYDCISPNLFKAGYDAVKYLAEFGHKRIAFIGDKMWDEGLSDKFSGYGKAIKDYNLEYDETLIEKIYPSGENDETSGYILMKKILEKTTHMPTAVFSTSDYASPGVLRAIKEKGLNVPEDISIVGCGDDFGGLGIMDPPITTFMVKKIEIGELAVRKLIERINNPYTTVTKTIVPLDLIERKSVKKL